MDAGAFNLRAPRSSAIFVAHAELSVQASNDLISRMACSFTRRRTPTACPPFSRFQSW